MPQKLKPGPIQRKWLNSLRNYPDRQMKEKLGEMQPDGTYRACCLGELCLIAGLGVWHNGTLIDQNRGYSGLFSSFEQLGLRSAAGHLENKETSLSAMNDKYKTWPEIADFVEANFDKVFTKSY